MSSVRITFSLVFLIIGIWAVSSNLNTRYLPWGNEGVAPRLVISVGVFTAYVLLLTHLMGRDWKSGPRHTIGIVALTGLTLTVIEVLYWSLSSDDHTMLARHKIGEWVAIPSLLPPLLLNIIKPENVTDHRRNIPLYHSILPMLFGAFAVECVFFAIRYFWGYQRSEQSSKIYYAMDCSMFAVLLLVFAGLLSLAVPRALVLAKRLI